MNRSLWLSQHALERIKERFDNNIDEVFSLMWKHIDTLAYHRARGSYTIRTLEYWFVFKPKVLITVIKVTDLDSKEANAEH